MFHTFQSSLGVRSPGSEGDGSASKPARTAGSRRISTSNACVECRRRKIRCDGTQPCGQCQWYQHPEACGYSKPAQRVVPSRKLVDKLSSDIEQYKAVLSKLYPAKDLEALSPLPREDLLELALSIPTSGTTTSPATVTTQAISEVTSGSEGADSLEALEQAPPEDPYWDEARKHLVRVQGISDDVNGLSMSFDKLSSYVGISSITAALKVIVRCAPQAKPLIAHNPQETAIPSRAGSPPPELTDDDPLALPSPAHGQELIESYFERVHLFFPMIDERKFWSSYLYGDRKDSSWMALLNMVFALGSLASSTADNEDHYVYFTRSRHHLSLESFGSGNLEVLQALAIMSGYYMHYLNRPNEAHSLMGGTLRMATALGLHREYSDASRSEASRHLNAIAPGEADSISPEMRRRIWWSLFCLDAWASTTTGRPSLGRMGPSITVLPPGQTTNHVQVTPLPNSPQYIEQLKVLPLIHASEFCKIATRIQDRLVESPLLTPAETSNYDSEVLHWYEELPSILSNMNESCPDFLRRVRYVMKWRFQNIRIVLHRPVLLSTALRRSPFASFSAEEKVAVGKCRIIAAKTMEDISAECPPDLISGWNAVWFVFQACMVPLVSLFSDTSLPEEAEKWKTSIEIALQFFEKAKPWSIAAKRSLDAVSRLYEAYKVQSVEQPHAHPQYVQAGQQQHQFINNQLNQNNLSGMGTFDYNAVPDVGGLSMNPGSVGTWGHDPAAMGNLSGFWDDMMWDTNLPDMLDAPFGLGNDYDFQGAAQDSGAPCWMQGN
ncbi:fungal-specific transcription factor domain-containing protein [Lophiotrema nucula]|uniref:Fungal-specific transcription factor domain-containing protein n=1 Tax=Lophiotrema nucula TaxID=690887 RepID=A0A6A5ZKX8_9PLEO|nr:fungal-specific transcription factor domain-containing protein [Lophiotrema nucula]